MKGMNYVSTEVITTELMKGLWTNSPSAAVSTQYNTLFRYVNTFYLIFQIFSYVLSNFGTFLTDYCSKFYPMIAYVLYGFFLMNIAYVNLLFIRLLHIFVY